MVFLYQWEEKFIFSVQMESYNIDLLEVNVQEGKEGTERGEGEEGTERQAIGFASVTTFCKSMSVLTLMTEKACVMAMCSVGASVLLPCMSRGLNSSNQPAESAHWL